MKKRSILFIVLSGFPFLYSLCVPPDEFFLAGFASLFIPFLILINVLCFFYCLYRRHYLSVLPLLTLIIYYPFWQACFSLTKSTYSNRPSFTILTYNLNALGYFRSEADYEQNLREFDEVFSRGSVDVLCFQEMIEPHQQDIDLSGYVKVRSVKKTFDGHYLGLYMYSRLPVVADGEIEFAHNSYNRLMWADILIHEDTIRLVNVHLMSYDFGGSMNGALDKIRRGLMARSWHTKVIMDFLDKSPHPIVLCGDFNENPLSYPYQSITSKLADSFLESGRFMAPSYFLWNVIPYRIDYAFVSPELKTTDYDKVIDLPDYWSDHYPVSVRIALPDRDG
ncbi:MAG: endonuclease/exonuclease/phosphatase family protein [Cyclobacteriaceae bacterium]|nr:endonuclease/exonuclease/phosphatase family protein [Cyclobacteriaceae bacterium]